VCLPLTVLMKIWHREPRHSSTEYLVGSCRNSNRQAQNAIMAGLRLRCRNDMKISLTARPKAKPGFAEGQGTGVLGERIYRGGIADRQIAACAGCHSPV
jgi:hypothetical protein